MPVTVPAPRLRWRSPRRAGPRRAVRAGSGSATATAGCASRARGQEFADPFDGPANSPPSSRGQVLATPFRGAAEGRLYCPPFAVPKVGTLSSAVISSPRPAAPWIRAAHVAGAARLVSMSELTPLRVSLGHIPVMCASGTRFARSAPDAKAPHVWRLCASGVSDEGCRRDTQARGRSARAGHAAPAARGGARVRPLRHGADWCTAMRYLLRPTPGPLHLRHSRAHLPPTGTEYATGA